MTTVLKDTREVLPTSRNQASNALSFVFADQLADLDRSESFGFWLRHLASLLGHKSHSPFPSFSPRWACADTEDDCDYDCARCDCYLPVGWAVGGVQGVLFWYDDHCMKEKSGRHYQLEGKATDEAEVGLIDCLRRAARA